MNGKNNYKKALAFYATIIKVIGFEERDLPHDVGMMAIDLFEKAKGSVSVPRFTAREVNELHSDFGVRENYVEAAFRDLAAHLRDPGVQRVIRELISQAGTSGRDDLYVDIKNVRLLGPHPCGPAVVTLVVHSYSSLGNLLSCDEHDRPEYVHMSTGR